MNQRTKRYVQLMLAWVLVAASSAIAQWQSIGNFDSYTSEKNGVSIAAGKTVVRVVVLAPDLVRIRVARAGEFLPDQSWAVVKNDWGSVAVDVKNSTDDLQLATSELTVRIGKRPVRFTFMDKTGKVINADDEERGISWSGRAVRVWKSMPQSEQYYGLGEKAGALNKKYKAFTMWNSDIPGYKADTDPLYQSIPFFYGINRGQAYGIFFDNSYWSSFDMGKEFPDRYSFGAVEGEMNYYFFFGPSPKKVLQRFTELVGRMPLPPRWALGYQQCRWSYYPESRVRKLASDFRTKKIPCDVIYLDIDYMEGYRIFTWSRKNFPNPQKMIADLSRQGFKVATIIDPGIKVDSAYDAFRTGVSGDYFLKYPDGHVYTGKVWPGVCAFPDFSNPKTRAWWGMNFSALTGAGVRGFWNDMNEPSVFDVPTKTVDLDVLHDDNGLHTSHAKNHNLYGLQMTQATYDGARLQRPDERPFVLTRASYAGGQRFSAAWTGDNVATWEHLRMAVQMMLGLSISGQPFVGSDIGGFIDSPDGELYARWLQLGVFSPLMRTHTAWDTKDQEPWSYGNEFEGINRQTIELRYKLLPYLYNAMHEASTTGIPPLRPLVFDYPDDPNYASDGSEFMFGDGLLVAPVLTPGARTRSITLPRGEWYDYWTGKHFQGGARVEVEAPIDRIPMFAKAGAVIPTQQVVQYSDQAPINPLTITLFLADSAAYEYYEDDGLSFDYQRGVFAARSVTLGRRNGNVQVVLADVEGSYRYPDRSLMVQIVGVDAKPTEVNVSGESLPMMAGVAIAGKQSGWTYGVASHSLWVKMPDLRTKQTITFH